MLLGHDLSKGQARIWLTEGMHLEGQSRAPAKLVTRWGSRSGPGTGANEFSSCVDTLSRFWTVLSHLASEATRGASGPVLCIEARLAGVASVAPVADTAVYTVAEMIGQTRSPIANHHRFS
jgi:hypothetical protein